MRFLILCSLNLVTLIAFVDWFFPRFEEDAKEKFSEWYLRFSDLDYRSIGPYMANLATSRLDQVLGVSGFGLRFFLTSIVLSQVIFVLVVVYIATSWGLVSSGGLYGFVGLFEDVVLRLGHSLVPLLVINTAGDLASIYVTRDLLRRASDCKSPWVFCAIMLVDASCAVALGVVTFLIFSQFIFANNFADSLAAFALNGSLIYVLLFVAAIGVFFIFTGVQERRFRYAFLFFGAYFLWVASVSGFKIAESEPYSGFLSFSVDDLTAILIVAVSATAGIPTLLGLFLLLLLFFINISIGGLHGVVSSFMLRMAETKKGFFTFFGLVLTTLINTMLFLYFDSR